MFEIKRYYEVPLKVADRILDDKLKIATFGGDRFIFSKAET